MVSLEKIAHLADDCRFDSTGPLLASAIDPEKLRRLGEGTRHDVCASTFSPRERPLPGICHAFTQDGRCVSLFKTLYTNHCTHSCSYCTNASGCSRKAKAFSYTPEELARITTSLYRGNYIEGLFLSSGSGRDEESIMENMIEAARLLRERWAFAGYIHLKILPGASEQHIREAMMLADRVSINLEAASASHMSEICATKDYERDIVQRQRYIRDFAAQSREDSALPGMGRLLPAGQTTQLVVGAAGESDREILERIVYEYREIGLRRAYYSAFSPQAGTVLEGSIPQPLWRERRLYQMDWLYRVYRFRPEEIGRAFDEAGFLPNSDPKASIARQLLEGPVDPNTAAYTELLRIPGIGPKSAQRIVALRKTRPIASRAELAALGVRIRRATPFLKINGWRDTTLEMWSD
ncbi:MAG TPA: helix-hairpin-helix domain-containing protein [Methanothrix sp.]|nr:helix-hairpin-helix domain-containing protein [Methanothrix sp.]